MGRLLTFLLPWVLPFSGCAESADLQVLSGAPDAGADAPREDAGPPPVADPLVLYLFEETEGDIASDSSAGTEPIHLRIMDASAVRWEAGALVLDEPVLLSSEAPPLEIYEACTASGAITLEAWVRPAEAAVDGTRRIVSASVDTTHRNFLLGQGAFNADPPTDAFVLRLRTTDTDANGLPMRTTGPGVAETRLMHVVATHAADGTERIYVDGAVLTEATRRGDLSSWDRSYPLVVGNELGADGSQRGWLGELHLVAIYDEALEPEAVRVLFEAGPSRVGPFE